GGRPLTAGQGPREAHQDLHSFFGRGERGEGVEIAPSPPHHSERGGEDTPGGAAGPAHPGRNPDHPPTPPPPPPPTHPGRTCHTVTWRSGRFPAVCHEYSQTRHLLRTVPYRARPRPARCRACRHRRRRAPGPPRSPACPRRARTRARPR